MRVLGIPISALSIADVRALRDDGVGESRTLDYKLTLPGTGDEEKKEFLADVSAFANTAGGVLLFGVATGREGGRDTGIPVEIKGIGDVNADAETLRLNQILRDGLSPRLSPVEMRVVPGDDQSPSVLAVAVPRSMNGPHAVWFKKSGKFFRRSAADKYQADVEEIRRMFLEASEWTREAEDFHRQRTNELLGADFGVHPCHAGMVMAHVLPLGRLRERLDLRPFEDKLIKASLSVGVGANWSPRFNYDGFIVPSPRLGVDCEAYVQWFRNGGVEVYSAQFLRIDHQEERASFKAARFTHWLKQEFPKFISCMRDVVEVDPPYAIFVSLLSMANLRAEGWGHAEHAMDAGTFDRVLLDLPSFVVQERTDDAQRFLQEMLDVMWQAAGFTRSPT